MHHYHFFVLNTSLFVLLISTLFTKGILFIMFQKHTDSPRFFYRSENGVNTAAVSPESVWRKRQNVLTRVALINSIVLLFFCVLGILMAA
jgi:hypothetical protein